MWLFAVSTFMLALAVSLTISFGTAKASEPGTPVQFDFNHAALFTGTSIIGPIAGPVLQPGDGRGEVAIRGTYEDGEGNFTVAPSGFSFPDFQIDAVSGLVTLDAGIALAGDARGTFDDSSGRLTLEADLALRFGFDRNTFLPPEAQGPLECLLSPLAASFSTDSGWPFEAANFTTGPDGPEGSIAGSWRSQPPVQAIEGGEQCQVLAGLVEPVGGLWLASSPGGIVSPPSPTEPRPTALSPTPPVDPAPPVNPDPETPGPRVPGPVDLTGDPVPGLGGSDAVAMSMPRPTMKARAGSRIRMPVRISNAGSTNAKFTARLRSNHKRVKVPRRLSITVPAGKTVTRKIRVKVKRGASGRATISARVGDLRGRMLLRVR